MIQSQNGKVTLDGNPVELLADLSVVIVSVSEEFRDRLGVPMEAFKDMLSDGINKTMELKLKEAKDVK